VDANSTIAQNGLLSAYADGAKSGLDQLADGAGQLLVGLQQLAAGADQLHAGLVTGADGTNQLAQGLHSTTGKPDLLGGSKSLAAGLKQIAGGLAVLGSATGLQALITDGIDPISTGVDALVAGLGDGSPTTETVSGGVTLAIGGIGTSTTDNTLKKGVKDLSDGVHAEAAGVGCVAKVIGDLLAGAGPSASEPCYGAHGTPGPRPQLTAVTGVDALVLQAILAGIGQSTDATADTLLGGLNLIQFGLFNPACDLSNPQVSTPADPAHNKPAVPVCGGLFGGLDTLQLGLRAVNGGVAMIVGGLSNPHCVLTNPHDTQNPCGVKQGLVLLTAGVNAAIAGAGLLTDGANAASGGADQIVDGLGKESTGLDQLAAGLPAAVDGSKQIADGLGQAVTGAQQIAGGQTQVRDAAVVPIAQALAQGGGNAAGTLAVLAALSTSASKPPLGTGTTLILTQSDVNPGATWPLWLAIVVAAAAVIVGLIVGLLIGPRRRRHGA
jgi:putative membrane protein